jgi:hypothetical protein
LKKVDINEHSAARNEKAELAASIARLIGLPRSKLSQDLYVQIKLA